VVWIFSLVEFAHLITDISERQKTPTSLSKAWRLNKSHIVSRDTGFFEWVQESVK
jgi:hypothetical protein